MKYINFKTLILLLATTGVCILYSINVKLNNNRFQLNDGAVLDTKTGVIYHYRIEDGYFKYINGKKITVKSLPE